MKRFFLLFSFLLSMVNIVQPKEACTITPKPISQTLATYPDQLIAFGKITKVELQYSEFTIDEVIQGTENPKKTVKIWDDSDFTCGGGPPSYKMGSEELGSVGDSLLIIVPKIVEKKNPWDVIGEYQMPNFHGLYSIFRFKDGLAYYGDAAVQIESKWYARAELTTIVKSYLSTESVRRGIKGGYGVLRYPLQFLDYDLLGRRRSALHWVKTGVPEISQE